MDIGVRQCQERLADIDERPQVNQRPPHIHDHVLAEQRFPDFFESLIPINPHHSPSFYR